MKYLAPLLVAFSMVCFTDPEGFAVWLDRNQIVSVSHPRDCTAAAQSKVTAANGTFFCIRETIKDALVKLDGAK